MCFCFQPYGDIQYVLTPVTPGADMYFDINESGQITVIRNLVGSGTDTYEVFTYDTFSDKTFYLRL